MKKMFIFMVTILLVGSSYANEHEPAKKKGPVVSKGDWAKEITADHSEFDSLKKKFEYAPDVTVACLECHTKAGEHIKKTFHWNWGVVVNGKKLGKAMNAPNNFCISAADNETMCTKCHIGYGFRDKEFDFDDEENIDCLVCHDTTGTYKKSPNSGFPAKGVDLSYVAQNVGKPQRHNCLACHANGGGGNGVKWGDTDTSLINPDHKLDVHMDADGLNMACQDCHTVKEHRISGEYIGRSAFLDYKKDMGRRDRMGHNVSCEACHGEKPHKQWRLNNHTDKVACQTCHVPYGARGGIATKLEWDWSKAGLNTEDKPLKTYGGTPKNTSGHPIDGITGKPDLNNEVHAYMAKKGAFKYGINIVPSYAWYKGERTHISIFDKFDPSKYSKQHPLPVKAPTGDYDDPKAKIFPFKIHVSKVPYDTKYNNLIPPKVWARNKGEGAFWMDFDWDKALKLGAEYSNIPFSGDYDFIWTAQYMQIKHMVAPEHDAVSCNECHTKGGRLDNVPGFYLVGRDNNKLVDWLGILMILGSLLGVGGHGFLRFINRNNKQD